MTSGFRDERAAGDAVRRAGRRRGRRSSRIASACLKFTAGLTLLAVVAAGVLVVRMNAGPIRIEGLGKTIESALHDRFGKGLRFSLGGTALVQHGFGPSLAIDRLSVSAPDGRDILNAPRAEVSVDTFALLFGKVVPKRLEVFDVTVRAVLLRDGSLAVDAGGGAKPLFEVGQQSGSTPSRPEAATIESAAPRPEGAPRERAVLMRKAAAGLRQFLDVLTDPASPIAAVDRLGISGGTLVIEDQESGQETVYSGLELGFDKRRGVSRFDLSAQGPSRRWSIAATARGRPGAERHFELKMHDLTLDEIQYAAGSRSMGLDTDMPIGAHLDIAVRPDNSLSQAAGGLDLGAGFLRLDDPDFEPTFFDGIETAVHWDGKGRALDIDKLDYREAGGSRFSAAGHLVPPEREGQAWTIALALSEPGLFAPDRKGQKPVAVERGEFRGHLDLDAKTFFIDRLSFKPTNGGFAAAGQFDWKAGPHVRLGVSMDPTPIEVVERVWPASVAAAVRAWVLNHFEAGLVSDGTLKIDYDELALKRMRGDRAPRDSAVDLNFKVTGGRVRYLDGVPPLQDVTGSAHVTGRTSHFIVTGATSSIDGRTIQLSDGTFTVPDSDIHPPKALIAANLRGPVEAIVAILSRPALKPYASLPLDPSTLHGQIEGHLEKTLLLGPNTDPSKEPMSVDARISAFQADALIGKESLENATMTLKVGDGGLHAEGQGRLFGGPATFEISRAGDAPTAANITVMLDDAARGRLGLSAVPGLTGPMTARVATTLGDPSRMKAQVEVDLAKTSVTAALLGLSKPAGRPGKAAFTLSSTGDHLVIDSLAVDIASLQARGSIDLSADNSFRDAHFSSFKVSPGDDMKLDVSKSDDVFKLTVRGSAIDARPFLKILTSTAGDTPAMARNAKIEKRDAEGVKGIDIDLKTNILSGFNKEVMSGVDLKLSKRGDLVRQLALQGRFGRQRVTGTMGPGGQIKVTAEDAGALVSFIDLYKHMEGGQLLSTMQLGAEKLSGSLEIRDFVLRDEPAIRRLVATSAETAAPGPNTEAARRIDGGAVDFRRLKVNFERDGSRLELRDATMYGPQIGLSVDGWLDYSHDRVGMKGTFVPAFAINNLFSQVPVLGVFLGGKSNEGLLAITFNISGQASSPTLAINPLSAIAPGFLRNIFGVLDAPVPSAGPPAYPATR